MDRENKVCCFFGHRKITETENLIKWLYKTIENLIIYERVDTFLFGSKSTFDQLCHTIVTELKEEYPHIRRIYVRAEYPYISNNYKTYLLEKYEDTYYPEKVLNAGRASYIKRNFEIIDKSDFCIIYYDKDYSLPSKQHIQHILPDYQAKSGTEIAYSYAKRKKKKIINSFH